MTQTTTQRSTVVGVFHDRAHAEEAVQALHHAGFRDEQIGYASRGAEAPEGSAAIAEGTEGEGSASGGAARGLVGGGLIGAVLGALATGLIPGIGPVIAGGLLAGIVGGAAIGAAGGGLLGALTGSMDVPEDEARYYDQEFRSGRTIVTVRADGRYDEAQRVLRQHGAYDISSQSDAAATGTTLTTPSTTRGTDVAADRGARVAAESETLQLREEELRARKETVQAGEVTLGKEVVSEQRTLEVPVTREEVYVERHPVERRPAETPVGEVTEQTIEVPVREEQVEVEKRPVVYEEVGIGKQQVVRNEQVSDTVRREELRIDKEGDVPLSGADVSGTTTRASGTSSVTGTSGTTSTGSYGTWDQAMPTYRQHWQERFGSTPGARWEDYEPGYQYGHELRGRPEYRGQSWTDIEPRVQRDWAQRNPSTPWDRVRESVRDAWDDVTGKREA